MSPRKVELYMLRHADAGDPEAWRGPDEDRPLSGKGERQATRLGALLAAAGFQPDVLLSSPKARAHQTAALIGDALGIAVADDDRLASGVSLDRLDDVIADTGHARRVVVVGHDPDFSGLLSELTGAPTLPMRKGAIARVDVELPLQRASGTLRWLIPPDALPRDSGPD